MPVKTLFEKLAKKRGVAVESVSLVRSKPEGVTHLNAVLQVPATKWNKRPAVEKLLENLYLKGFLFRAQRGGTKLRLTVFVENERERKNNFLHAAYDFLQAQQQAAKSEGK